MFVKYPAIGSTLYVGTYILSAFIIQALSGSKDPMLSKTRPWPSLNEVTVQMGGRWSNNHGSLVEPRLSAVTKERYRVPGESWGVWACLSGRVSLGRDDWLRSKDKQVVQGKRWKTVPGRGLQMGGLWQVKGLERSSGHLEPKGRSWDGRTGGQRGESCWLYPGVYHYLYLILRQREAPEGEGATVWRPTFHCGKVPWLGGR